MGLTTADIATPRVAQTVSIQTYLGAIAGDLIDSLPAISDLSPTDRRGMIARYSVVLEGNFIYWMTGAYLAARSGEAKAIIIDNLYEEVRDCHPGMLRRFVMLADAEPNAPDARAVHANLTQVRLFIGQLSAAPIVVMMAFFEDFIQRFMPYLADLAASRGSDEREYTEVHGLCDVAHSQALFHALEKELELAPDSRASEDHLFEGVHLLKALIESVIGRHSAEAS